MTYNVVLYEQAQEDLARLALSEPKAFAKVQRFIEELKEHPKTGTGRPEALKGNRNGQWSREITKNTGLYMRYTILKSLYLSSLPMATITTNNQ